MFRRIVLTTLVVILLPTICAIAADVAYVVDGDPEGIIDLGDLTKLIDYLFITFTPPAECL